MSTEPGMDSLWAASGGAPIRVAVPLALFDLPQDRQEPPRVRRDGYVDSGRLHRPRDQVERRQPVEHELEGARLGAAPVAAQDVERVAGRVERIRTCGLSVPLHQKALISE